MEGVAAAASWSSIVGLFTAGFGGGAFIVTKVAAGSSMYCAAGKLHGIVNTGKTPLLFYYFKWKA